MLQDTLNHVRTYLANQNRQDIPSAIHLAGNSFSLAHGPLEVELPQQLYRPAYD
jgi:hypothetical protein